jgi:hypothetical protein
LKYKAREESCHGAIFMIHCSFRLCFDGELFICYKFDESPMTLQEFLCKDSLWLARLIRASIQLSPCGGGVTKNPSFNVIATKTLSNDDGQSF